MILLKTILFVQSLPTSLGFIHAVRLQLPAYYFAKVAGVNFLVVRNCKKHTVKKLLSYLFMYYI